MNLPVLTIASGNKSKVSEISEMLDVLSLRVQKQPEYLNVEETGNTYFENALLKAKAASLETKTWALADDSGLEVDVLDVGQEFILLDMPKLMMRKLKN